MLFITMYVSHSRSTTECNQDRKSSNNHIISFLIHLMFTFSVTSIISLDGSKALTAYMTLKTDFANFELNRRVIFITKRFLLLIFGTKRDIPSNKEKTPKKEY